MFGWKTEFHISLLLFVLYVFLSPVVVLHQNFSAFFFLTSLNFSPEGGRTHSTPLFSLPLSIHRLPSLLSFVPPSLRLPLWRRSSRKLSRFTFQRMLRCKMDSSLLPASPSSLLPASLSLLPPPCVSLLPASPSLPLLLVSTLHPNRPPLYFPTAVCELRPSRASSSTCGAQLFLPLFLLFSALHCKSALNKKSCCVCVSSCSQFYFWFVLIRPAGFSENDATVSRVCWRKSASRSACCSLSVRSVWDSLNQNAGFLRRWDQDVKPRRSSESQQKILFLSGHVYTTTSSTRMEKLICLCVKQVQMDLKRITVRARLSVGGVTL